MTKTRTVTRLAAFVAAAVLLGYVESLFPPVAAGVKLGIANTVIIIMLYTESFGNTFAVSLVKVFLCMMLFGSMTSFIYSLCGALISLTGMYMAKRSRLFSLAAVSSLGGLLHNMAQLLCAYFIIGKGVLLHMPVLALSGLFCGAVTGAVAQIIIRRGREIFGKE